MCVMIWRNAYSSDGCNQSKKTLLSWYRPDTFKYVNTGAIIKIINDVSNYLGCVIRSKDSCLTHNKNINSNDSSDNQNDTNDSEKSTLFSCQDDTSNSKDPSASDEREHENKSSSDNSDENGNSNDDTEPEADNDDEE